MHNRTPCAAEQVFATGSDKTVSAVSCPSGPLTSPSSDWHRADIIARCSSQVRHHRRGSLPRLWFISLFSFQRVLPKLAARRANYCRVPERPVIGHLALTVSCL